MRTGIEKVTFAHISNFGNHQENIININFTSYENLGC